MAPRGRSQPAVTSPRKPLGQRTNLRAPHPAKPQLYPSGKQQARPVPAAARQLSLHGLAAAASAPKPSALLPSLDVKPQPGPSKEAGQPSSGRGSQADEAQQQSNAAEEHPSADQQDAEDGELMGDVDRDSAAEETHKSEHDLLRQESSNRTKVGDVESAFLRPGEPT